MAISIPMRSNQLRHLHVFLGVLGVCVAVIEGGQPKGELLGSFPNDPDLAVYALQDALILETNKANVEKLKLEEFQQQVDALNQIEEISIIPKIELMRLKSMLNHTLDIYQYRHLSNHNVKNFHSHLLRAPFDVTNWVFIFSEVYPARVNRSIDLLKEEVKAGIVMSNVSYQTIANDGCQNAEQYNSSSMFSLLKWSYNLSRANIEKAKRLIEEIVFPNMEKALDYFCNEYASHVRPKSSLASLPGGKELYSALVRMHTTTDLTPAEIHEIGRREIDRISKEMERIKTAEGFNGTLQNFYVAVEENAELYITDEHEFKQHAETITIEMNTRSRKVLKVAERNPVEIKFVSVPNYPIAAYGSKININVVEFEKLRKQAIIPILLHEGVPGHHTMEKHPAIVKPLHLHSISLASWPRFLAYIEGWALYAESLGHEMGYYKTNMELFERYDIEMLRAVRLVSETGIHFYGWSQDKAKRFIMDKTTLTEHRASTEVWRTVVMPGQALSYKIGELKIWELRRLAEKQLGDRFDLREFNYQILSINQVPLNALEYHIRHWIKYLSCSHDKTMNNSSGCFGSIFVIFFCAVFSLSSLK